MLVLSIENEKRGRSIFGMLSNQKLIEFRNQEGVAR